MCLRFGKALFTVDVAVQIIYRRAQALHALGKDAEAFQDIEQAKRLRPNHYMTRRLRLHILMALGKFRVWSIPKIQT